MKDKESLQNYQKELTLKSPQEVIKWALDNFKEIVLASSLGAEDQVLTDMLLKIEPKAKIFTLDTGLLNKETYEILKKTSKHYQTDIEVLTPDKDLVKKMEKEHGPGLFYKSVKLRKYCCEVRKIKPLKKKLAAFKAWICGLRKSQAVTRKAVEKIEWDEAFGLFKMNPLADWSAEQVWQYIRENKVPYNLLHDQGYPSIGCQPCTRAVKPGEDIRAGRWWWENPEQKECGIHIVNGKVVRSDK